MARLDDFDRMARVDHISTLATGADSNSMGPDSITLANGDIWVAYTNGASSTGGSGSSTIVEYDRSGHIDFTTSISGSVDGLKLDPVTGQIWALQNQDGNSTLTLINPEDHTVSGPLSLPLPSTAHGYDDVAFTDGKIFLSYTNPNPGDPILVQFIPNPDGTFQATPILSLGTNPGALGANPDSLKAAPNGDLLLTSEDGVIIDVHNPGATDQTVSFTTVQGAANLGHLDDVIMPNATSGTFYLSDSADNRVLAVHVSGLNVNDYYVSIGNAFGQVDPTTGQFTPLVTAANAPGFVFGSAHGATFVADGHHDVLAHEGGADQVTTALMQLSADAQRSGMNIVTVPDAHIDGTGVHTDLHAGLHFV
jgi:hypothetical protein